MAMRALCLATLNPNRSSLLITHFQTQILPHLVPHSQTQADLHDSSSSSSCWPQPSSSPGLALLGKMSLDNVSLQLPTPTELAPMDAIWPRDTSNVSLGVTFQQFCHTLQQVSSSSSNSHNHSNGPFTVSPGTPVPAARLQAILEIYSHEAYALISSSSRKQDVGSEKLKVHVMIRPRASDQDVLKALYQAMLLQRICAHLDESKEKKSNPNKQEKEHTDTTCMDSTRGRRETHDQYSGKSQGLFELSLLWAQTLKQTNLDFPRFLTECESYGWKTAVIQLNVTRIQCEWE